MLKIIRGHYTHILTAILCAAGFLLCGIAWGRFFSVATTHPSPVRYLEFVTDAGTIAPFQQTCAGPGFIQEDTVWRFCAYGPDRFLAQWGMVRADLAAGSAELRWPLPEPPDAQILALAAASSGDLAVAFGAPHLSAIYLIRRDGGVISLGTPGAIPDRVSGLAWAADTLELAGDDQQSGVTIYSRASDQWDAGRALPRPAACGADTLCALQVAEHSAAGWRFVYARTPVDIGDLQAGRIDLIAQTEAGAVEPLPPIPLVDLDPSQYSLDDSGRLTRLGVLFDRSPGNAVNWQVDAAPFVLADSGWTHIMPPQADARFYFSNYRIENGSLHWIPGLRNPQNVWRVNDWVTLRRTRDGLRLARLDGDAGPVLTASSALLNGDAQTNVLPATDGGYWVLGPHGAYLKADQTLQRTDHLNILQRITRAFENFGRLNAVSDEFYHQRRAIKLAAFPVVLLSLPLGYLLVFFVGQTRQDTRAWTKLLLQVSAIYLLLATIFFWWFWQVMSDF
jgi:hypothetical protein